VPTPPPDLEALRRLLLEGLRPHLGRVGRVALLDFPRYGNVGDRLLWLGALEAIRTVGPGAPVYTCTKHTFDPGELRRRLGDDGLVLLLGGGSFGDLWPGIHQHRLEVLRSLADLPVLQLPQSVWFQERGALWEATKRALGSHPRFHLLVRERQSLEIATAAFDAPVTMLPDLALALPPPPPPARPPRHAIVWLGRRDKELLHPPPEGPLPDVHVADWVREPRSWRRRWSRTIGRLAALPGAPRALARLHAMGFDALARRRVRAGVDLVAAGSVLVTDRLHGHVLAAMLGRPHVVLDNAYGKVGAVLDAWTGGLGGVHRAADGAQALERARALLAP
jgi:pyruvyl transferase EpsO